jgi:uncharacterized linocin/CFP29 family protein
LLGKGTELNFENDGGLDSSKAVPSLSFEWRIGRRHRLGGWWMNVDRNATNTILTEEQFTAVDEAAIQAAEERLVLVDLFRSVATVGPVGLGVILTSFRRRGTRRAAEQSIRLGARRQRDRTETEESTWPVPITAAEFDYDMRELLASQRTGDPIDVADGAAAGRQVAEALENAILNGGLTHNGQVQYGLTNFPQRNTHTISTAWDAVTNTDAIKDDVLAMKQLLIDDNMFGPFGLIIGGDWDTVMDEDYDNATTLTSMTVRDRLMAINGLQSITVCDNLAAQAILVQLSSETLDWYVGEPVTTVEWATEGEAVGNYRVFTAATHRLKADYSGNCGIVHGS